MVQSPAFTTLSPGLGDEESQAQEEQPSPGVRWSHDQIQLRPSQPPQAGHPIRQLC